MRRVIITGGSRGIGAACVKKFANNKDKVVFIYKSNDEAAKGLTREFENVSALKADISEAQGAEHAVKSAAEVLGGCDILINNAGIAQSKLMTDITDGDYKKMLDTDLGSAFYCSRAVIPEFLKTHSGVIINISSMWGEVGASMEVHYSAAKAGLIGMTKAMAKELGYSGIRVNCVTPGMTDTDMNACYDEETIRNIVDEIPLGRIGKPEDVANAVFFLASEEASYITGQVLGVNGGMVI
ncbi:MAG: SDR family oxidoreductase [Ruminococcaceae bacterium]|nr:SDR family oxidoreductase [Oscillospiraceae bacterium]